MTLSDSRQHSGGQSTSSHAFRIVEHAASLILTGCLPTRWSRKREASNKFMKATMSDTYRSQIRALPKQVWKDVSQTISNHDVPSVERSRTRGDLADFGFSEHRRLQCRLRAVKEMAEGEGYKIAASDIRNRQLLEEPPNALDDAISKRRWEHLMWKWRQGIRLAADDTRRSASQQSNDTITRVWPLTEDRQTHAGKNATAGTSKRKQRRPPD